MRVAKLTVAAALALVAAAPARASADTPVSSFVTQNGPVAWAMNMYDPALVRWQDPDQEACAAAATEMMLNMTSQVQLDEIPSLRGGLPLPPPLIPTWNADLSYEKQEEILAYAHSTSTLEAGAVGADANGWRNALNYYGWGSVNAGVYRVSWYGSYGAAAHAVVRSLAIHKRPIGILGWYGSHAQFVTGYVVTGEDPRVSDNFSIEGVYLTDPLQAMWTRNLFLSYGEWEYGPIVLRFSQFWQPDSTQRDPLTGMIGTNVWWSNWVIVDAVK
jgi:hypothetical protein